MTRKISNKEAKQSLELNECSFTAGPCNNMPTVWDTIGSYATDPEPWWIIQDRLRSKDKEIKKLEAEVTHQKQLDTEQITRIDNLQKIVDHQEEYQQNVTEFITRQEEREKELIRLLIASIDILKQQEQMIKVMQSSQQEADRYAEQCKQLMTRIETILHPILAPLSKENA